MNLARLLTSAIFSGCLIFSSATMKADNADFSRPKTVITDSQKELTKALADNDSQKILASLIDITLAQSMIDNDSLQSSIDLISSVGVKLKDDTLLCRLLDLLKADILSSVYNRNRWVYDSRELPMLPLAEDMRQWSGKQFRHQIDSLIITSLSSPQILDAQPIDKWRHVITVEKGSEKVFPTLLDFVGFKAISLLRNNASSPSAIRWMAPVSTFIGMNTEYTSSPDKIIIDAYKTLLSADKNRPVSAIYTDLNRLQWTGMRFSETDTYFEAVENLTRAYPHEPASVLPLFLLVNRSRSDVNRARRLINLFEDYRKTFGQTVYDPSIDQALNALKAPEMSFYFPDNVKKDRPFEIKVNALNCRKVTFTLYSTDSNGRPVAPVTSRSIDFDNDIPFQVDSTLTMSAPSNGTFALYSSINGKNINTKEYAPRLTVSSIFPAAVGLSPNKALFFAADVETGKPIPGVSVTTKNRETVLASGKTDSNGSVKLLSGQPAQFKDAENGTADLYTYSLYNNYGHVSATASFTTSLPVYHPGDKLQWAMIAMSTNNQGRKPIANGSFTIFFHDANNTKLDSVTAHTDRFGRISGEFEIPTGGLTGYFHLRAYSNSKKSFVGASSVMVSDYKLPTFTVKISSIERDIPAKGDVTVKGSAQTYTGFPIADAEVVARLSGMSWSFWHPNTDNFYSSTIRTDSNGLFSITFADGLLKQAPENSRLFAATFDVVSSAGETRSTSCNFTTGKRYGINLGGESSFDIASPVKISPNVTDPSGNSVSIPLKITLSKDKKDIFTTEISTPTQPVNFAKVKPGEYTLTVASADTTLADPVWTEVILYNSKHSALDISSMLWSPTSSASFDSNNGEILLATNRDNLTVNMVVTAPDSLISQKWLTLDKGLSHIKVDLPDKIDRAAVYFIAVNNFESTELRVSVTTPPARRRLDISVESFRDKVQPLEKERWTFTTRLDSDSRESALLLNIFAASINDIKAHKPFSLSPYRPAFNINVNSGHMGRSWGHNSESNGFNNPFNFSSPTFDLHGYSWIGNRMMRRYAVRGMAKAAANGTANDAGEVVVEEEAEAVFLSAAPMDMKAAKTDYPAMEDAVVTGRVSFDEEAAVEGGTVPEPESQLRPSEVPLALFSPMLTTGDDGTVSVSFTWPNAVTEWIVNTSAWDESSNFATLVKHAVSAKSLMVNTNAPRFVRTGNHAVITSTVMNSTDETINPVKATIEIRSLTDNSLIASADSILSLAPRSSGDVTIEFDVDNQLSGLLVISRATGDRFTDGEQSAIAVLPAAEPVITTDNFYLTPGNDSTSVEIETRKGGKTTLEVNLNPTWAVVTALPGLIADKPATSVEAALSYFSAMTASGILNTNPEIKQVLDKWTSNDKDSVLVSALSRNPDLKSMMLDATPWVVDAMNDTRRMARLALLFNDKESSLTIKNAISTLKSLERKKGGWSWSSYGDEPSEWATMSVLYMLGNLKSTGYAKFDRDVEAMISRALGYIDNLMIKRQQKSKTHIIDPFYAYVRAMYPETPQPSAAVLISANTVNSLVAGWKKLDVTGKALAAQLLYRKNYRTVAGHILESISQFATTSPERGMFWANIRSTQWWSTGAVSQTAMILDAYQMINPKSADIDRIRQWLILEKSRQNWGEGLSANLAITSILKSGTEWTVPANGGFTVTVDGKPLIPDNIDRITGYFRSDITDLVNPTGPTRISITKNSPAPTFGTVYDISPQKIEDVKASDNIELSVDKKYYVRHVTPDGDQWIESDTFNVGDRVRTTLTVKLLDDLSYVTVKDLRPACLEPVNQLPETVYNDGVVFYRENRDTRSLMFIDFLPRGVYVIAQEFNVDRPGVYSSGTAEVSSSYAPRYTAHSSGAVIVARP